MENDKAKSSKNRRLGRGLAQVSHIFLSGASDREPEIAETRDFWLPERRLITVTSGKGLRGKSLVSSCLAYELSRRGRQVTLLTDDRVLLSRRAGTDGGVNTYGIGESTGFEILEISPILGRVGEPEVGVDQLERIVQNVDTVIVDLPADIPENTSVWALSRLAIVITQPGTHQMQSAYAVIKRVAMSRSGCRIGVVVNLAMGYDDGERCFRKISQACREFLKLKVRNYGYVVASDEVARISASGEPPWLALADPPFGRCFESIVRVFLIDDRGVQRRRREVKQKSCV